MGRVRKAPFIPFHEVLPGFFIPGNWAYDPVAWPNYTDPDYVRFFEDPPNIGDVIVFMDYGKIEPRAWGAWYGALQNQRELPTKWPELQRVARQKYESARYVYLVPAWKRAITKVLTDLDNIEDQIATILWVMEIISRKFTPLPERWLAAARRVENSLDCAQKIMNGGPAARSLKPAYADCVREMERRRKKRRGDKNGLVAWLAENQYRLIEAAQATGTWFDVGIVLGPIMGWIDEGIWSVGKGEILHGVLSVEGLIPGYYDATKYTWEHLSNKIDAAWDESWGTANLEDVQYDPNDYPGFFAP